MNFCMNLQIFPSHLNLESLQVVRMGGCWNLRKIPDISRNVTQLAIADTMLEESPESIEHWSRLEILNISGSAIMTTWVEDYQRSTRDIERLPYWIKDLHALSTLYIAGCPKLASLPELPPSLRELVVDTCESLETVSFSVDSHIGILYFANCLKLGPEARRVIIQQSGYRSVSLPGRIMPAEFDHQATGSSVTILSKVFRFKICVVIYPKQPNIGLIDEDVHLQCLMSINRDPVQALIIPAEFEFPNILTEHLLISHPRQFDMDGRFESDVEILFQFSTSSQNFNIIECGVKILAEETDESYEYSSEQVSKDDYESLSDGSYKSCSENMYEDDDESLFVGGNESCS